MQNSRFNQLFVFCGICHRQSSGEHPLNLTSCAHTLCSQHIDSVRKICPICHTPDVSVIKLVDDIPNDIRIFFQPISQSLETLYNVSQFQINGLTEQCKYYRDHCFKLREKCARQRQLLFQARQELNTLTSLKNRVRELESQTKPFFSTHPPPPTVDLTLDEEDTQRQKREEESFVQKLKKTAALKNRISTTAIAESTQLDPLSPSLTQYKLSSTQASSTDSFKMGSDIAIRTASTSNEKVKLPNILEKLHVVRRQNTFSGGPSSSAQGGIINHMRSSGRNADAAVRDSHRSHSNIPTLRRVSNSQSHGRITKSSRLEENRSFKRIR